MLYTLILVAATHTIYYILLAILIETPIALLFRTSEKEKWPSRISRFFTAYMIASLFSRIILEQSENDFWIWLNAILVAIYIVITIVSEISGGLNAVKNETILMEKWALEKERKFGFIFIPISLTFLVIGLIFPNISNTILHYSIFELLEWAYSITILSWIISILSGLLVLNFAIRGIKGIFMMWVMYSVNKVVEEDETFND